ncbi:MAG: M56 family metallopeptidase [Clostridia bacterium]|nr:M56 family metallopeptidase [Clostridia bacterium]
MLQSIFKTVVIMSLLAGIFTSLLLLAKPVTQRLFGHRWQYFAWYAVLFVSLVPLSIKLPTHQGAAGNISYVPSELAPLKAQYAQIQPGLAQNGWGDEWLWNALCIIWLMGALACMVYHIVQYLLFVITVRKNSRFVKKYKGISVKSTSLLTAPLSVGLFRKTILIPCDVTDSEIENCILKHEYVHIKHYDILFKWICMLANCVHWFNPLMYVLRREVDRSCELVCDTSVTKHMSHCERREYMNTILSMVSRSAGIAPLSTQMASSAKNIKQRFAAIASVGKRAWWETGVSGIMGAIMLALCITLGAAALGSAYESDAAVISIDLSKPAKKELTRQVQNFEIPKTQAETSENEPDAEFAQTEQTAPAHEPQMSVQEVTDESAAQSPAHEARSFDYEEDEGDFSVYHPYSGQVKFDGLTMEALTAEIEQSGIGKSAGDGANLKNEYVSGTLTYKNGSKDNIKNVRSDEKGQIIFYMPSDYERHVEISFLEDGKVIAGYGMVPDSETIYAFGGFDPDKSYDITVSSATGDTWMVESDYIIY